MKEWEKIQDRGSRNYEEKIKELMETRKKRRKTVRNKEKKNEIIKK